MNQANWTPSYNVRAETGTDSIEIEYQAQITQDTGESWDAVSLTLSTATPLLVADPPQLNPLSVRLVPANAPATAFGNGNNWAQVNDFTAYSDNRNAILEQQQVMANSRAGMTQDRFEALQALDVNLMKCADDLAVLDIANSVALSSDLAQRLAIDVPEQSGVAVSYVIDQPVTMPSRREAQLLRIDRLPLEATTSLVAMPGLSEFVYREAEARNTSGTVLLAGPLTSFLDGQFVGHGTLPNVAAGESVTIGLGVDETLRTAKVLVERDQTISGGNRVVEVTYRLTLENFGDQPRTVRMMDRLPHDASGSATVELVGSDLDLSDDSSYVSDRLSVGILEWPMEAAARTDGRDATHLLYTFKLEHDRNLTISPIAATDTGAIRLNQGGFGGGFEDDFAGDFGSR